MSFYGLLNQQDSESNKTFSSSFQRTKKLLQDRDLVLKAKIHELQTLLNERPPVWIPDEERSCCFSCHTPFSFFHRRHHCRSCGEIFDSQCTSHVKLLPCSQTKEPQRVCNACYILPLSSSSSSLIVAELSVLLCEEDFQATKPLSEATETKTNEESTSEVVVAVPSKLRSEIPPPPPLPENLDALLSFSSSNKPLVVVKKTSKKFVPPKQQQQQPMSLDEIKNGLHRLKKFTTPTKSSKPLMVQSDFQRSIRKRRLALEGSSPPPTSKENRSQSAFKSSGGNCLLSGLRESVKTFDCNANNVSINSSFTFS